MEYIYYYSTPEDALRAGRRLNKDDFTVSVDGSNLIVRCNVKKRGVELHRQEVAYYVIDGVQRAKLDVDPILRIGDRCPFFDDFLQSGMFSDLILRVSDNTKTRDFKVHRIMLASASDYFKVLLTKMKESAQHIISINDTDPDIFQEILNIIYGKGVVLSGTRGLRILLLVNFLQIKSIDIDNYVFNMDVPPLEDLLEFIDLLNQLYPMSLSENAKNALWEAFDFYASTDQHKTEFFRSIWPLLPEYLRSDHGYLM